MGRYPSNGAANRRSLVPSGSAEKEAEVGLAPEEPPVRIVVLLLYRLLVKRDRGTDHITVLSVELTDAIRPAPWCADRMSTLVGVGLLEAATA
jgi:hypothetical protein